MRDPTTAPAARVHPGIWRVPVLLERECQEITAILRGQADPSVSRVPAERMSGDMLVYAEVMPLGVGPLGGRLFGIGDPVRMRGREFRWATPRAEPSLAAGFGAVLALARPDGAAPVTRFTGTDGEAIEVDHPIGDVLLFDRTVRYRDGGAAVELIADFEAASGGRV